METTGVIKEGIPPLDELLAECSRLHGHMCAGQLLGARMALLGCRAVGVNDPRGADRKKLIVWVEIDRCMADAIGAVTGVRLGKRSLKYFDYGKVAATFLNTETGEAVRVVALEESRALADARHPEIESKKERQFRTYREAVDEELFKVERVRVDYDEMDAPGRPLSRVTCARCGEGVNDGREVRSAEGVTLCRPCASGGYYRKL
ncbi:MAG: formylmethanofuran dehydrogenase [Acidobacteria bacterium]|nr:MAG: formylmethanofuran dehydrogenase [Acidobacteriota bacterium]